jgi:hypothetical protein
LLKISWLKFKKENLFFKVIKPEKENSKRWLAGETSGGYEGIVISFHFRRSRCAISRLHQRRRDSASLRAPPRGTASMTPGGYGDAATSVKHIFPGL